MPIKDIRLAVTVQLTQIEKHKKIIEETLQGQFFISKNALQPFKIFIITIR